MPLTTALLHSGGRDSIVLTHVLEPWLDEILILWVNTGAAYESTLKQMRKISDSVPHFFEVVTDQPADIDKWGFPTDVLPVRHDIQLYGNLLPKLQTTYSCCAKNIWLPTQICLKDKGIKTCYIGSREDEASIGGIGDDRWNGTREGVEYRFPLRKWTAQMVQDYVIKHNITLPPYYSQGEEKSRDCWNCTGYLWERKASIAALPFYQKEALMDRLNIIDGAIGVERSSGILEVINNGV